MQGDIGNAYLESFTYEKVYFIADPEFGPPEGHLLIIVKSLYGLHSSGICFHEKLADTLHPLYGFQPSLLATMMSGYALLNLQMICMIMLLSMLMISLFP